MQFSIPCCLNFLHTSYLATKYALQHHPNQTKNLLRNPECIINISNTKLATLAQQKKKSTEILHLLTFYTIFTGYRCTVKMLTATLKKEPH